MKKGDFYIFLEKCLELMTARALEKKAGVPDACIFKHEKYIQHIREHGFRKKGTYVLPPHHFYKIALAVCRTLPVTVEIGDMLFLSTENELHHESGDGYGHITITESEFNALFK
jgi:hypothetical protein